MLSIDFSLRSIGSNLKTLNAENAEFDDLLGVRVEDELGPLKVFLQILAHLVYAVTIAVRQTRSHCQT